VITHHLSLFVNNPLGKVPRNLASPLFLSIVEFFGVTAEELEYGVRTFAIHENFGEHGEFDAILFRGKSLDFSLAPRFLIFKLIAGEGKDFEAL